MAHSDISIFDPPNRGPTYTRELGEKYYELTDHLGNVRAVLGDRKLTGTPGAGNYYADIEAYSHPYPFGMPQPGRTWDNSLWYRYGFNGMESDLGVKGTGNHYTTYFRQYDPRSGRWWSTDPVIHPWQSSYTAMDNNPVRFTDPFGDDCVGCPDPNTVPVGTEQTDELGNLYINWEREDNTGHYWEVRTETAEVLGKRPELTPIWDMGSGEAQDPPPTQLGQAQQTIAANWSNLRGLREQQALALRNSINPAADVTRVVLPIPGEEASKFMGASVSGDNVPRMSAPPPGWSLQRPFEKETTAAEWFESTDIPLMAVVRGITEIPARSLEVTANYACILATGKRCDGSDPTPEDLESGYYSLMPGGGKGAAAAKTGTQLLNAAPATLTQKGLNHILARHAFSSTAKGAGKFAQGTTARQLKNLINTATTKGIFRPNTFGRPGTIAEFNFGRTIGTNISGNAATNLRVVIGPNGNVITAFPF